MVKEKIKLCGKCKKVEVDEDDNTLEEYGVVCPNCWYDN